MSEPDLPFHWDVAARKVAGIAAPYADAVDRDGRFPAEAVAALRESGLLGALVPVASGGLGLPLRQVAGVTARLGRACGATGMIFAMHQIQLACLLHHHGGNLFLCNLLKRVARAPLLIASVTSEAGVGGDIRRSLCMVEHVGGRCRLQKHGSVISYGAYADGYLVTARADAESASNGQVLVAVLREQVELEQLASWDTLGMRGTCSDGFRLTAGFAQDQIFAQPFGDITAATMLPVSHLLWGSLWFGIAQDAFARARICLRAAMKRQGSLPQAAQQLPALCSQMRMLHALLLSSLERYEAAFDAVLQGVPISLTSDLTMLKTTMSNGCLAVAQQALSIIGFAGYRNGVPESVGRQLRDLHSAPLMINNARITETMSSFLLLSQINFELA